MIYTSNFLDVVRNHLFLTQTILSIARPDVSVRKEMPYLVWKLQSWKALHQTALHSPGILIPRSNIALVAKRHFH